MIENIENFFRMIMKKDKNGWKPVIYPPPVSKRLFGFIPIKLILLVGILFSELILVTHISDRIHNSIGQILLLIILIYLFYKTIVYYRRFQKDRQEGTNV